MRRRLDLAAGLVGRPDVLFLDEPTTGLDGAGRLQLWELIEELVADGATVLLTNQYLEEADRLAARIAVIGHGRVIAEGTPEELKRRLGGDVLDLTLADRGLAEVAAAHVTGAGTATPYLDREAGTVSLPIATTGGARWPRCGVWRRKASSWRTSPCTAPPWTTCSWPSPAAPPPHPTEGLVTAERIALPAAGPTRISPPAAVRHARS
jgi:hypothetical protein